MQETTEQIQTITEDQVLMLKALEEVNLQVDFFELRQLVTNAYENALLSELFVMTPKQCHANFYMYKILYNFLLKLDMYHDPEMFDANLL